MPSLMAWLSHRRYQGVDWRDVSNWGCNGDVGPTGTNHNDGHTLDPYEAMFVKFKGFMLEGDSNSISAGRSHPSAVQAAKYQLWQDQQLMEDDWDKNISGECASVKLYLGRAYRRTLLSATLESPICTAADDAVIRARPAAQVTREAGHTVC